MMTRVSPAGERCLSLGDEHVSAPADQDDQTGACGREWTGGGPARGSPVSGCARKGADPLDGPAGPAAEDQGIPRLQNGAARGGPTAGPGGGGGPADSRGQERVRGACPPEVIRRRVHWRNWTEYLIGVASR
ncbi:MAG: hypothetical protein ACLR1T_10015 [Evtepia gabavorous]